MPGFSLTTDQPAQCRINCMTPCATCSSSNPYSCNSCIAGYKLVNGACQADTSCNNMYNCQVCPFGFSIMSSSTPSKFNQTCQQCTKSNCARCNATSQQCMSCLKGFFLSGSTCTQCNTGCATCLSRNFCLQCGMGYIAQQAGTISGIAVNPPLNCLPCVSPCQTCINSPTTCTSCVGGFTLKGGICVSSFNFQVNVVFGVNLQTFQQNYFNFINQLANAAQVTHQNILIQSITAGSVSVNSLVNANYSPSSNQAANINQNLNNLFTSNSLGMPITSYSVTTNGGTIPTPDDGGGLPTSTIIILAVCIPVGTLCNYISI